MFGSYIDAKVRIYLLHNCFFFSLQLEHLKHFIFGHLNWTALLKYMVRHHCCMLSINKHEQIDIIPLHNQTG